MSWRPSIRFLELMLTIAINTPSLNHERYVGAFVKSIYSQEHQGVSLSVVDDASSDRNFEELCRLQALHGFTLQRNEVRRGIAATLNRAYAANRVTDLVFGIASDDLLAPGFVGHVNKYFRDHPTVDAITGSVVYIDSEGRTTGRFQARADGRIDLVKWARGEQQVMANWMVVRRHVMDSEKPYDEAHKLEDLPFFIRVVSRYDVRVVDFDLLHYRKHDQSYSSRKSFEVYVVEGEIMQQYRNEPFYVHYERSRRINWFLSFSGINKAEAWRLLPLLLTDFWRLRVLKGIVRLFFYYPKK